MFFLLRMAFWLGIVLMLLPISTAEDGTRQIGAWQALTAAQSIVSDMSGFCERQPQACAVGGQLLSHLGDKAQATVEWLFANVSFGGGQSGHHLTPQDLVPGWGGENESQALGARPALPAPAETQSAVPAAAPASVPLPPRRPA